MAGLEPARAYYGPTDFKSVASTISPHRLGVIHPKLVVRRVKMNFALVNLNRRGGKRFVMRADEKLTAFLRLAPAFCVCGELPRQASEIFPKLPDMKMSIPSILSALLIVYLELLPKAQAISPPPDGSYPGGNTAEGQNALLSLTSGTYNTALGWFSLESVTTGNFNTATGAGTLVLNTADGNTATGAGALLSNTTGGNNTASGVFALFGNTTGGSNTATGFGALGDNTTGSFNTADGGNALLSNTTGANNTATGYQALFNNTVGNFNTATGINALLNNINADGNTATGFQALQGNTTGSGNTATGGNALPNNSTGGGNTAIGNAALLANTIGDSNTAIGTGALAFNTTGSENTALGAGSGGNVTTATGVICIGSNGANVNNSCFIGNIYGVPTVIAEPLPVLIDSAGQLGTMSSSKRFKKQIKPMDRASEAILAFKPVTFHYKTDTKGTPQFGLIAEEVAKVNPDLVVRDENGEIYTVRYDAVNAMLLNEFLKEHRKVEELQATVAEQQNTFQSRIAEQEKQIAALASGLQKVSQQIQMSRPAPQVATNN